MNEIDSTLSFYINHRSGVGRHTTDIIMPPLVPLNGDKILLVNLKKSYDPTTGAGVHGQSLYDITRGDWIVTPKHAAKVTHVLGVYEGTVVSVVKPKKWYKPTKPHPQQRHTFTGRQLVKSTYLKKNINHLVKPLRHIKYLFNVKEGKV